MPVYAAKKSVRIHCLLECGHHTYLLLQSVLQLFWIVICYHVMLIPTFTLAFELSGMPSLLILPRMWSMPIKKL